MPRVDFSRLSSKQYEDMISVLLSRIRQTRRVDGNGGDGGRDCYFSDQNDTDELKSFLGRMNDVRRQQVVRSLQRALKGSGRAELPSCVYIAAGHRLAAQELNNPQSVANTPCGTQDETEEETAAE